MLYIYATATECRRNIPLCLDDQQWNVVPT